MALPRAAWLINHHVGRRGGEAGSSPSPVTRRLEKTPARATLSAAGEGKNKLNTATALPASGVEKNKFIASSGVPILSRAISC